MMHCMKCFTIAALIGTSLGCGNDAVAPSQRPSGVAAQSTETTKPTETTKHSDVPKDGYVPDEKTAIKIAVAIWEPIYGEKQIADEKPYQARLDANGIWTVEGSLPEGWVGGVAIAEIAKDDGRILNVIHGK